MLPYHHRHDWAGQPSLSAGRLDSGKNFVPLCGGWQPGDLTAGHFVLFANATWLFAGRFLPALFRSGRWQIALAGASYGESFLDAVRQRR